MRKSVLMRRVFGMVILAVMLTVLFTALAYTAISRTVFTRLKANELLPKAQLLSRLAYRYQQGGVAQELMDAILEVSGETSDSILGAYALVVNRNGQMVLGSSFLENVNLEPLSGYMSRIFNGEQVAASAYLQNTRMDMVCVGTPIVDASGQVQGAAMLFVPMVEAMAAMGSLNSALLLSLALVMPFMLLLTFMGTKYVVKPLKTMRDAAIAMANGDFSIRADDTQRGEIGQLGSSLNFLARELSRNISELTVERNRFKQIIDGLSEGIVAVDTLGNITHHNPALVQLFERQARHSDDARMQLIPDESVWEDFDRALSEGNPVMRSLNLPDRVLRIIISPLADEEGHPAGAVGLFSDITQSERLERTRRDYVANVSHEMRTPLTAMRALVEPMRDGMVKSEQARQRYYDIILRETLRLSRLIDDLMQLSKLQSGNLALTTEPISLNTLLEDIAEKYRSTAAEAGMEFTMELDPGQCPMVVSNADRIEQVLVILLDNAIKYTKVARPEGGKIALGGRIEKNRLVLFVRDNGIGISPADQPYVFDRFYKVDKSHSGLGSGLGLSIAKEILNGMGENIDVKSTPGEGSEFYFTIKLAGEDRP